MRRLKSIVLTAIRSLASFFAGYSVLALTNMGFVLAVFAGGSSHPSAGIVVAGIPYTVASTVLAGWLTARIAPRGRMGHAAAVSLAMGAVITVSIIVDVSIEPTWYKAAYLIIQLPGTMAGGYLGARRHNQNFADVH